MAEKKKEEFVVSDRRRFVADGELRSEPTPAEDQVEEEKIAPEPVPPAEAAVAESEDFPEPPSEAEQQTQRDAYHASGRQIDAMIGEASGRTAPPEMTFERLVESFYMTALIQMGAVRAEGEQPRVDLMGARQTIDSLNILQEKTKGNLSEREQHLLQNVLFELRMAWIEITNAIAKAPARPPGIVQPAGSNK